jgi:photosystem II stability/assembly factor-like uncharacterized protein
MKKIFTLISLFVFSNMVFAQNWTSVTSGITDDIYDVQFATSEVGYAVATGGKVLKTTDSGTTWSQTTSPNSTVGYFSVECINFENVLVFGEFGRIYKSTDGGNSWAQKTTGTTTQINGSELLIDGSTIFAVGGTTGSLLLKSTDIGETWSVLTSPTSVPLRSISFSKTSSQIGYLCGDNNAMYKTTDGGVNWTLQTLPFGTNINAQFSIYALDNDNAISCGGNQRIIKTTNGGTTWTNISNTAANFYRGCYMYDATKFYVVGGNGRILYSSNGGTSFTSQTSGTTSIMRAITVSPCGISYAVGDGGVMRKRLPTITGGADTYSTTQDVSLTVNAADGVLKNDVHQFSASISAILVNGPASGNLTLNSDGSFMYEPVAGFSGQVTFTYKPTDACGSASAANITVTINVVEPNVAPVANPDFYDVDKNKPKTVNAASGVLINDTDANASTTLTTSLTVNVVNGTLTLNANGSFTYTPTTGFVGLDSFAYKAFDGELLSNEVYVVFNVENTAPIAISSSYETDKNITLNVNAPGVLTGATDFNNDNLTAVLSQTTINGTLSLNEDGSFQYVPTNNYVGLDSFAFKASDSDLESDVVYVVINIKQTNTVKAISKQNSIKIYPTIATDKLYIETDCKIEELILIDCIGNSKNIFINNLEIDIEKIKAGIYYLKIIDANNQLHMHKFVKK